MYTISTNNQLQRETVKVDPQGKAGKTAQNTQLLNIRQREQNID